MKVIILTPKSEFTPELQSTLSGLGQVIYTDSRRAYPLKELVSLCQDADILAFDPDNIGGFEVSPKRLVELLRKVPTIRALALSTTSFGYVDRSFCQSRGIQVTNVPHYSSESVAEHAIALLLGCTKRIFLSDRRTQRDQYQLEMGYEIVGKTVGIIGLGNIGQRTATLANALGLKVIGWNRTAKKVRGVVSKSLDQVLSQSDLLSLHLADNSETTGILSSEKISRLKRGVMIVNTASRDLVDEHAMAQALKSGLVDSYALEAEDLTSPPLGALENAFLFKGFGWYTKEALARNKEIWVHNIVGLVHGQPVNPV